jgi:hypothetical protein
MIFIPLERPSTPNGMPVATPQRVAQWRHAHAQTLVAGSRSIHPGRHRPWLHPCPRPLRHGTRGRSRVCGGPRLLLSSPGRLRLQRRKNSLLRRHAQPVLQLLMFIAAGERCSLQPDPCRCVVLENRGLADVVATICRRTCAPFDAGSYACSSLPPLPPRSQARCAASAPRTSRGPGPPRLSASPPWRCSLTRAVLGALVREQAA